MSKPYTLTDLLFIVQNAKKVDIYLKLNSDKKCRKLIFRQHM